MVYEGRIEVKSESGPSEVNEWDRVTRRQDKFQASASQ